MAEPSVKRACSFDAGDGGATLGVQPQKRSRVANTEDDSERRLHFGLPPPSPIVARGSSITTIDLTDDDNGDGAGDDTDAGYDGLSQVLCMKHSDGTSIPTPALSDSIYPSRPAEIEQRDADLALVLACVFGDLRLGDLPERLRRRAKRMMKQQEAPAVQGAAPVARPVAVAAEAASERTTTTGRHSDIVSGGSSVSGGADADARRRQELEDEELARKLQQEEMALSGAGGSTMTQPSHPPTYRAPPVQQQQRKVEKESTEPEVRRRQLDEDAALARKLQAELDREAHEEAIANMRQGNRGDRAVQAVTTSGGGSEDQPSWSAKHDPYGSATTPSMQREPFGDQSPLFSSGGSVQIQPVGLLHVASPTPPSRSSSMNGLPPIQPYQRFYPPAAEAAGLGLPAAFRSQHLQGGSSDRWRGVDGSSFESQLQSLDDYNRWGQNATRVAPYMEEEFLPSFMHTGESSSSSGTLPGSFRSYPGSFQSSYSMEQGEVVERPLQDKEAQDQLKNLLENVAVGESETPKEMRIKSPPDLRVTLLEHQKIGVEWMLNMENGTNKGGILADDMGLGKTVQSISCCLLNKSTKKNCKTTLIVAPTSLIYQWRDELEAKVKPNVLRVLVYYGKEKKGKTANSLKQYDVVITTFGTLALEWPQLAKKGPKDPFTTKDADDKLYEEEVAAAQRSQREVDHQKGELFRVRWYRVVLDEAHSIKNKRTRAAQAAGNLDAVHRWCLTGTPLQNNVGELYSLIQFLNIKPYCEWSKFRDDIERPFRTGRHKKAVLRVQAVLK
ncbi:hypothetical protein HK405_010412, partial [Cladochytrium tenue]